MDEVKQKLWKKFEEMLGGADITEMSYDEIYNEIVMNSEDVDALFTISEGIRFNKKLTDFEKEKLWELIDKLATIRG